jgi:hypothetical protein
MTHQIIFRHEDHPNLVEPSPQPNEWNLTQDVKSWLATNNIKVFTKYTNGEYPTFTIDFTSRDDAQLFMNTWSKHARTN